MQITYKKLSLALAGAGMLTIYGCGGGGSDAPAPVVVATPLEQAQAFLATYDASLKTVGPTTGAANAAFNDGCSLNDGYTKPVSIANFDENPALSAESFKYKIGSTRTNVQILADRTTTNTDGSNRRELDIQYKVDYADGTVNPAATETLISGSSSGSITAGAATCSTPENASNWRFFGNRSVVSASVRAVNQRSERYSLAAGVPLASAVDYSKFVQLVISDPGNIAKYVVVTGPGLPSSGVKMVSPRIQRDDPLFAGKRGNNVDWNDTDNFTFCRADASTSNVAADTADCVAFGAASNNYGSINKTAANADAGFNAMGFVAGGAYRVAVYNDEGWKTVNGQAGKTPIATYTQTLSSLPYSAVALAGSGVGNDLFPRMSSSLTPVQTAANIRAKTAFTTNLSWTGLAAMPDAVKFGWGNVYNFVSGTATATANAWPGSRQIGFSYPATGATGIANYAAPAPSSKLVTPTFAQFVITLTNRNETLIQSLVTFE